MRVGIIAATLAVLFMTSCAPRFTVYIGMRERMNVGGVTLISVDTVKFADDMHKKVTYSITSDMTFFDRLFLAGKIRRAKKEVDFLSQ